MAGTPSDATPELAAPLLSKPAFEPADLSDFYVHEADAQGFAENRPRVFAPGIFERESSNLKVQT